MFRITNELPISAMQYADYLHAYNIQMTKMYTQYIMSHNAMCSNWPFVYISAKQTFK